MIDSVAYSSKFRYKSPCLKFSFAMITLILCVIDRSIILSLLVLTLMGALIIYSSRASIHFFLHLISIPILFVVISTITIMVNISESPLSNFAIPVFGKFITISRKGFYDGITLMLTALSSVSCLYFLSLTTPITDILIVLKSLHCPAIIIELVMLIYRFIFILLNLAHSISTSQKSRLGNLNFFTSLRSMAALTSVLLIRALNYSSSLYDAMESRCYDGTIYALQETQRVKKNEVITVVLIEFIFICICLRKWWWC